MNSTPPLSSCNRYSVLDVYSVEDNLATSPDSSDEITAALDIQPTHWTRPSPPIRLPRWERRLPRKYVIASTPSANSLDIKVEIVTTDTQEIMSIKALIDSGATGLFIDQGYVNRSRLTTRTLSKPIPVFNVDGTPNEAGSIREVVDVVLRYQDHSERVQFAVTGLGKQDVILGYTWL